MNSQTKTLLIRCFVYKTGDVYAAHSIEFGLACQASTLHEASTCLTEMVRDYLDSVFEAIHDGDLSGAKHLLTRKADWLTRLTYIRVRAMGFVSKILRGGSHIGSDGEGKTWKSNNSGPCLT